MCQSVNRSENLLEIKSSRRFVKEANCPKWDLFVLFGLAGNGTGVDSREVSESGMSLSQIWRMTVACLWLDFGCAPAGDFDNRDLGTGDIRIGDTRIGDTNGERSRSLIGRRSERLLGNQKRMEAMTSGPL